MIFQSPNLVTTKEFKEVATVLREYIDSCADQIERLTDETLRLREENKELKRRVDAIAKCSPKQ